MANIGYIQVNRHCNNACHFCSNPSNGRNISYEEWVRIIDDFVDRRYAGVIFTGGEPTLSPDLPRWIEYSRNVKMEVRVISNGMMCASSSYMERLSKAWLDLIHFSVYSYNPKIHDFLTNTEGSWKRLMCSIENALSCWVRVQINTVINHYNEGHLDSTIRFLVRQFPGLRHFVWNNLDPIMMRQTKVALSTLPSFEGFMDSLHRAMIYLQAMGCTFRVERVPLCYMRGFEHASTETRKIVKGEERVVHFLDEREVVEQTSEYFVHDKWPECSACGLDPICAGIWMKQPTKMDGMQHPPYYADMQYRPQIVSSDQLRSIIDNIKSWC